MNRFPRKAKVYLMSPAEIAIRNAVLEVEKYGADVRLTKAVNLLCEAQDLVAEWIDEEIEKCKDPAKLPDPQHPR